jgi:hypothetical protein
MTRNHGFRGAAAPIVRFGAPVPPADNHGSRFAEAAARREPPASARRPR